MTQPRDHLSGSPTRRPGRLRGPLLALLAVTILAACDRNTTSSQASSSKRPEVVVLGEDFANIYAMEALKGPFEQKLGVRLRFAKNTFDVFDQKAKEDLGNGTSRFDVILHYSSLLSLAAEKKNVLTIPELKELPIGKRYTNDIAGLENDLSGHFLKVWEDSSHYAVRPDQAPVAMGYPFAANTMVLVYNKQLFAKGRPAYEKKFGEPLAARGESRLGILS